MATSPNKRYTVLDWALWAREKGKPGADDLVRYLHTMWPAIPANHYSFRAKKRNVEEDVLAVGVSTVVANGGEGEIMARHGTGLRALSDGGTEALKADLTHERRDGVGCGH